MAQDRRGTAAMGQAARADLETAWSARAGLPVVEQAVIDWVKG